MKKLIGLLISLIILLPLSVNAQASSLREQILENNPRRTNHPSFDVVANNENRDTEEGLFQMADEHGAAYIFRGTHELNNNVIFAGHQWKILRIDGNNNIRLIYNGNCPNNNCTINGNNAGSAAVIGTGAFNPFDRHNRYVGYMFGSEDGTFEEQHANTNNSLIKTMVDNWFAANITGASRNLVVNSTFCNDRTIGSSDAHMVWLGNLNQGTGMGTSGTAYAAIERLHQGVGNFSPTLICPRAEDRLSLPVGIITADEASIAGVRMGQSNTDSFLSVNQRFWTMTPGHLANAGALMLNVNLSGYLNTAVSPADETGARPVITLRSDVIATGNGSASDPFIVTGVQQDVTTTTTTSTTSAPYENVPTNSDPIGIAFSVISLAVSTVVVCFLISSKNKRDEFGGVDSTILQFVAISCGISYQSYVARSSGLLAKNFSNCCISNIGRDIIICNSRSNCCRNTSSG